MEKPFRYQLNTSAFAFYWRDGVGKELLNSINSTPKIEDAEKLIPYLFEWDKISDQVIIDLYLNLGFKKGNKSLEAYLSNNNPNPSEKHIWDKFFSKIDLTPNWLDKNKLKVGSEFCRRPGLSSLIVLRDYCLMGGYESSAINKPLIYTGALKKGAAKRLSETVEFWVQITKEGNLSIGYEGLKQVFLTRMIHSYSRVNILEKTDWDISKWGIPINIWDMLATNLGFSLVFLVGLRKMGVNPSHEEIEGLFHFWKYLGYLLGIPIHLLPDTEEQAIHALYLWTMTQAEADEDSKALAKVLYQEPLESNYPKDVFSRKIMREVHLYYNLFFLGEYSCKQLEIPKTTIGRFGIINMWQTKRQESKIIDKQSRLLAIEKGGLEQEKVRRICQDYNK